MDEAQDSTKALNECSPQIKGTLSPLRLAGTINRRTQKMGLKCLQHLTEKLYLFKLSVLRTKQAEVERASMFTSFLESSISCPFPSSAIYS